MISCLLLKLKWARNRRNCLLFLKWVQYIHVHHDMPEKHYVPCRSKAIFWRTFFGVYMYMDHRMNNFSILSDHLFYSLIEYAEDRRRKGHSEGKITVRMSVCMCHVFYRMITSLYDLWLIVPMPRCPHALMPTSPYAHINNPWYTMATKLDLIGFVWEKVSVNRAVSFHPVPCAMARVVFSVQKKNWLKVSEIYIFKDKVKDLRNW